jgi:para-nitrobenzyl esterase
VSFIEERGGSFADVKAMRALSVDQLMKGADKNLARMDAGPIARLIPAVDGYVIPDEPAKLFAEGKFHRVPLMIGATRDEATMFLLQSRVNSPQLYREMVAQQTGDLADEFESIFPAGEKPLEVKNATNRFLSVTRFIGPMRYIAGQVSRFEPKVYYYHFTHVPANTLGQMMGSHHAAEIRYVFGNLSDDGKDPPGEKKLADVMMNCWIEFAKSGDPNGEHIPNWPTHSVTGDDCLEFGDTIKATQGLLKRECDAFDKLLHQELEEMESASSDSRVSESR